MSRNLRYIITLFSGPFLISGMLLLTILLRLSYAASPVNSTITPDGSLGTTVSRTGKIFDINGGTIKGTNLFESFSLFNLGTGDTANFNGPTGIENIVSRVTGGQQSFIDGLLRSTISDANLYFLNPYGVLFGKNASLDVKGSFHASTADYIRLADGGTFYTNLSKNSVLTIAPPSAFGFLTNSPAAISIQESRLAVPKGKTLSVVGGDINITGGTNGYLWAPGGQINLVSAASPGEVNLSDFNTGAFSTLGNITVSQRSFLNVEGSNNNVDPAGAVLIRGGRLSFQDSNINARGNPGGTLSIRGDELHLDNTFVNTGTRGIVDHPGTAVDINMTGDLLFTNGSEIASSSSKGGRAGDVRITAGNIQLGDDDPSKSLYAGTGFYGDIGSRAFASGPGGNVYITADNLTVKNGFFINTAALSSGNAGNVTVHAGSLNLSDGGSISSNGLGTGSGGIVDVVAGDVVISGKNIAAVPNCPGCFSGLAAQAGFGSKGGLIRLNADNLQILDGGAISTLLFSIGPGASIEVSAKDILISGVTTDNRVSPSDIHASIDARVIGSFASGTGGNISITADRLRATNGGFITSSLFNDAPGNAGNISLVTKSLEVSDRGAVIASAIYGKGNAGRLDIVAQDISITGPKSSPDPFGRDFTGFSASANAGHGGDLSIVADSLVVADRGSITSASLGPGHAGNIEIDAGNVELLNGANIISSAFGSGNGGNIKVKANTLLVTGVNPEPFADITGNQSLNPSGIASQAGINGGNAGIVEITASSLHLMDGARITAETFGPGNGGGIEITADNVIVSGVNKGLKEFLIAGGGDPNLAGASLLTSANDFFIGDKATGNAGNIQIAGHQLKVQEGGLISSQTDSPGNGGNIDLTVDLLSLPGKGTISAKSSGAGYAGNISVKATDSLLMKDSSITTEATLTDGGDIHVKAGKMVQLIDSKITASVGGGPQTVGGNITIDPSYYVILNDSRIVANAFEGKGGNIRIKAGVFLASPESVVDASSKLGINGTVDIRAPVTSITGGLLPIQENFLNTETLLRDRCAARIREEKFSSFIMSGRDGLPISPDGVLPSPILFNSEE